MLFGKPIRAAIFLVVNGLILYWPGSGSAASASMRADAEMAARRAELATPSAARAGPAAGSRHAAGPQPGRSAASGESGGRRKSQAMESDPRLSTDG